MRADEVAQAAEALAGYRQPGAAPSAIRQTPEPEAGPIGPSSTARLRTDGKLFACGEERFRFRGVTYGTFKRREDGALFPETETIASDMRQIAAAGFTIVRTYTTPSEDLREHAAANGLRILAGAFFADWRYLLGHSRREWARMARCARELVRESAGRLAGDPTVAALAIGNEVPADVVRWAGCRAVAQLLGELAEIAREQDPELLITYGNYPSTEYLELPSLDFLTFNVFLEREADFRAYLTRLHNLAGDRPVVLGEIGLDAGQGEDVQAQALEWQLRTALERGVAGTCVFAWTDEWWVGERRVEDWQFGLTTAARRPRPALQVAARWNRAGLADLQMQWPSISAVVCARNAQTTLDECLRHLRGLDYPELEVLVVDDGSTDGTAGCALRHDVEVIRLEPSGLSRARTAGARAARGEIVAFIDSDAFPPPEWPYLLALGFDTPAVGGVGGPNLPPRDDPLIAQAVARAPGGPTHVLLSDDRAEHLPGCNMAFWRELILELDGFDPVFTAAGDDVDFCWRVLDAGWELAFHPAAFVWHRRRSDLRAYARQQRGYGRAEALVQARHPDRFTPAGTARWRGSLYGSLGRRLLRQRVYRGQFGSAAYQSVYRGAGHGLELSHQLGVPAALLALLSTPAALLAWPLALPAAAGLLWLLTLAAIDAVTVSVPPNYPRRWRLRLITAALHLVQPLARVYGRLPAIQPGRRCPRNKMVLPGPVQPLPGGVLLLPLDRPREQLVTLIVSCLCGAGLPTRPSGPWEDHDATVHASNLIAGRLLTSAHPEGSVQLRIDPRPRAWRLAVLVAAVAGLSTVSPLAAALLGGAIALDLTWGLWRVGPRARATVDRAATRAGAITRTSDDA